MVEYSSLGEQMFKAKFYIHEFGVEHVIPWIMAMRNENKITYLATNVAIFQYNYFQSKILILYKLI